MSKRTALVDLVCAQREQMKVAIALLIAAGLMVGFSLVFLRPGDQNFPILVIDVVLIVVLLVFFGGTFRYCTKREMEE